jgi:hypothetical protein
MAIAVSRALLKVIPLRRITRAAVAAMLILAGASLAAAIWCTGLRERGCGPRRRRSGQAGATEAGIYPACQRPQPEPDGLGDGRGRAGRRAALERVVPPSRLAFGVPLFQ